MLAESRLTVFHISSTFGTLYLGLWELVGQLVQNHERYPAVLVFIPLWSQCLLVPPCCALERVRALKTSVDLSLSCYHPDTPFFISYHLLSSSVSPTWGISQINLIVSLYTWRVKQHLYYGVLSISWPCYSIFCLLHMTMIFLMAETLSDATCIIQSFV